MLKAGMIIIWPEALGVIPAGFVICDGNNGTPNLQNRFVIGAGGSFAVGDTNGSINHDHNFISDTHFHNMEPGGDIGAGIVLDDFTISRPAVGTTDTFSSLPPFHALFYIMKI